jgi:hypothetical protein
VQQQSGSSESADQRASLRRILDIIESCAPDAGPEILDDIEQYLRARNAKEIGSNGSKAVAIDNRDENKSESVQELKYLR